MKEKHFIDSHKGVTGLAVLLLIAWYGAWENPVAWLYLAMHGGYGLFWILKSRYFGDSQWEKPASLARGATIWFGLSLYWIGPWLITSGRAEAPSNVWLFVCVASYALGLFFHFVADMQKFMWMQLKPGHLLKDGLWSLSRNPNYFGELLIYFGFSALACHPGPLCVLAAFVLIIWLPNMWKKDSSLSRYPEFAAYAGQTKMFIPFLW